MGITLNKTKNVSLTLSQKLSRKKRMINECSIKKGTVHVKPPNDIEQKCVLSFSILYYTQKKQQRTNTEISVSWTFKNCFPSFDMKNVTILVIEEHTAKIKVTQTHTLLTLSHIKLAIVTLKQITTAKIY